LFFVDQAMAANGPMMPAARRSIKRVSFRARLDSFQNEIADVCEEVQAVHQLQQSLPDAISQNSQVSNTTTDLENARRAGQELLARLRAAREEIACEEEDQLRRCAKLEQKLSLVGGNGPSNGKRRSMPHLSNA
jgi:septal ring factor EnvC (AmiA/AmiB activator)